MRRVFLSVVVVFFIALFSASSVYAALTWTQTQPGGNNDFSWTPSAISSDGQKMIVGEQGGTLYISSNGGSSWTLIDPTGGIENPDWYTTSMSSNGQIIVAGVYAGRLYRSTDGGDNWSEIRPDGNADVNWYTTSMSSDGQIMLAGVNDGRMYKSTNGGDSWSETRPAGDTDIAWNSSKMSSDGQVMLAGSQTRIYISTNAGSSWSETRPAGDVDLTWISIGISANGQVILAGTQGNILYLSTNGGSSWSAVNPTGATEEYWYISSVSSDGQTLFTGGGNRLYLSTDVGNNWSQTQPAGNVDRNWVLGSMSSDSQVLLAGVYDGRLYLGSNPLPPTPQQSSSNNTVNSTTTAPSCNDATPNGIPNLFQIDAAGTYVNLYFTGVNGSSGYNINYGLNPNANQYGDSFGGSGQWVVGRTISGLSPNTTYYFRVQAANGCTAGNWSSVVSVKTKGLFSNVAQWFANLAGNQPIAPTIASSNGNNNVLGVSTSTISGCSYTVQRGDNLWNIAQRKWGTGLKYKDILALNSGMSTLVKSGQIIKLCK